MKIAGSCDAMMPEVPSRGDRLSLIGAVGPAVIAPRRRAHHRGYVIRSVGEAP
jgi:hypothetical protein